MVDFGRDELERWLTQIELATSERCRRARGALSQHDWLSHEDGPRKLFASYLFGELLPVEGDPFEPNWVSWVEDHPPYLSLTSYPTLVIDLIPCGEQGFVAKYGCTPEQLVRLLQHRDHRLFVNIRNPHEDYLSDEVRATMGPVLALCTTSLADRFYRLAPIREDAFARLGVDLRALEVQAQLLCGEYEPALWNVVSKQSSEALRNVSRTQTWLPPEQLRGRLTYYLAARKLWPSQAPYAPLDEWIGDGERPLLFSAERDFQRPRALLSALSTAHHVHTAPLTGALGGNYGWLPHEMDLAGRMYRIDPPYSSHFGEQPAPGIADWLFAFLIGDVSMEQPVPTKPWHAPSSAEWDDYLARAKDARARGTVGNLARLFGEVDRARAGRVLSTADDRSAIAAYVEHIEQRAVDYAALTRTATRVAGSIGAGMSAAGAAGVPWISVPVGLALTALSAVLELSAHVPGLREYREALDQFLAHLSASNVRRTELRSTLGGLL